MTDAMQGLVGEAKRNKYSSIGPTLSDEDVCSVWDNVSGFIDKQMSQQKGVNIPGLGTFTFSQKKLDVGNNKYILIQRPVFLLSEKFAQTHGLNSTKHHVTGQIPVVQLNYAALSFESPFDRDSVEACVKEVLQALARSVGSKRNVEFTFNGIGRLTVRDSKVKMKFYKEFINSVDGSGKLVDAMKDRPGTVDSVMSDRAPSRPHTSNTLVLPSPHSVTRGISDTNISGLAPEVKAMPTIMEDENPDVELRIGAENADVAPGEYMPDHFDQQMDDDVGRAEPSRSGSRVAVPLAKASGVTFDDDLLHPMVMSPPTGIRGTSAVPKSSPTPMMLKRSLSPLNVPPSVSPRGVTPNGPEYLRSRSVDSINLRKPTLLGKIPTPPLGEKPASAGCGHNAGQELCYLCHQRARRNVPVSFTEERKRREQEEDKLLQQFQHMQDTDQIIKEQETLLAKRHENQKMAAFNLGVSEAVKSKKTTRAIDFHASYVFQKRPLTPPRFIKQEKYFNDLEDQVTTKSETEQKRRADDAFLERLEQVQLAEDFAAQREQYLQEKNNQQEQYKRSLSAQIQVRDSMKSPASSPKLRANKRLGPLTLPRPQLILPFSQTFTMKIQEGTGPDKRVLRFKPLPMPARVSDSSEPIFGKNDMNNDKMVEKRKRAHELYKEQLQTVEQRKREAILKRLHEQKEEEDMLHRTKDELLDDRANRYERLYFNRKGLETDWSKAVDTKRGLDKEERDQTGSPGMLLHEQCDKYKRCGQCKRKMHNCGESNIWRESRYIPGSRLMV